MHIKLRQKPGNVLNWCTVRKFIMNVIDGKRNGSNYKEDWGISPLNKTLTLPKELAKQLVRGIKTFIYPTYL